MKTVKIEQLKQHISKQVIIRGFVQKIREQSKIKFLILRDISGTIQCISHIEDDFFEEISKISTESVVEIKGLVKQEKQAPSGVEIQIKKIKVLSLAQELPIQVYEKTTQASISKRLDYRWLDLRKQEKTLIFKVWTEFEKGIREYFDKYEYMQIYTPSLMSTASESGSEVFEVKYFEKKAYLAQSPQFYKQMALAGGFEKVFMTGPVFRAEKSHTTRHLTEFTGFDVEIAYVSEIEELMEIEEDIIISGFKRVKKKLDIKIEVPKKDFPKITLEDAKERLKQIGIKSEKEDDLSPEEERGIYNLIKQETGHDFVFITRYPITIRPFYHMRDEKGFTKSFDLLYKGLEITTGAIREHTSSILEKQAIEKKMDLISLEKYFEFFKFGCPPHGGFGIGPSRIIMGLLDLESIKEATLLPRDVDRLIP